jgi:hypothetical protein
MYWVMWDRDETGLYENDKLVLSWRELQQLGYSVSFIAGWTSRQLERIVNENS